MRDREEPAEAAPPHYRRELFVRVMMVEDSLVERIQQKSALWQEALTRPLPEVAHLDEFEYLTVSQGQEKDRGKNPRNSKHSIRFPHKCQRGF